MILKPIPAGTPCMGIALAGSSRVGTVISPGSSLGVAFHLEMMGCSCSWRNAFSSSRSETSSSVATLSTISGGMKLLIRSLMSTGIQTTRSQPPSACMNLGLLMYSMERPWKPSTCLPPAVRSEIVTKLRPFTVSPLKLRWTTPYPSISGI